MSTIEGFPDGLLKGLQSSGAYPNEVGAASDVSTIQTHISWLFLNAARVYKLRKAVNFGFVDFATRQQRNRDCLREVTFNRRLAPDVYLGVAPVSVTDHGVRVGVVTQSVTDPDQEHCVVMRRLPQGRAAANLIMQDKLTGHHVDAMVRAIVGFHRRHGLGQPAPFTPEDWLSRISAPVEDNLKPIAGLLDDERVRSIAQASRNFINTHCQRFEMRRRSGCAVDGHGDLHLDHVWFETDSSDPLFIDCIEFSDRLRQIDVASEVAFVAMDLTYRGRSDLADRFLRQYATESGDFHLYSVVDYFVSYRATVRAKVAALTAAATEPASAKRVSARDTASRHLDVATEALSTRRRGAVVVMTGLVGTGKSTAAKILADAVGRAVVISSDRVRKRGEGLRVSDRTWDNGGLYSKASRRQVYLELILRAEPVVSSGRVVILDATFSQAYQRQLAIALAGEYDLPLLIVETRCRAECVVERLGERQRQGVDPSDAGPAFYEESARQFLPVDMQGHGAHIIVNTGRISWQADLRERVKSWQRNTAGDKPRRQVENSPLKLEIDASSGD